MKKFSDFGIKHELPSFTGDKIKIVKVLNKEIIVHAYKLTDSNYDKNKSKKCLHLQIEIDGAKRVVFTGSDVLITMIQKVSKDGMPFTTTIIEENEHFEFT